MSKAALKIWCLVMTVVMATGMVAAQTSVTPTTVGPQGPTQEPATEKMRRQPRKPSIARVTVVPSTSDIAPQVVTIVHRLSGVKILRLLMRQAGENGVVETLDPETFTRDAHANIIAGWTFDDGKTVAARLPQAAAEIEFGAFQGLLVTQNPTIASPFPFAGTRTEPDLTVITNDGKKLRARLIGLDAETGLSILQVSELVSSASLKHPAQELTAGQAIEIFAPEPSKPEGQPLTSNTYVKLGKVDATISQFKPETSGKIEKITVRATGLTPDVIGGIACDKAGNMLGIVDAIEGVDARLVSANTVRAATQRVLERRASVPRPVLGIRGESVEFAVRAEFLARGWPDDQLNELLSAPTGILLTSVMPRTPAAFAKLKPGDVIVKVNQQEVKSAEQFSKMLGEAGSGEQVNFTVKRPNASAPFSVPVMLGGSFASQFEWRFDLPASTSHLFGLQELGIHTMALTAKAASQFGAPHGLIVVSVQPGSAAARGGIREGDVLESIDGKRLGQGFWTLRQRFTNQKKHVFAIIRDREKKQLTVETNE